MGNRELKFSPDVFSTFWDGDRTFIIGTIADDYKVAEAVILSELMEKIPIGRRIFGTITFRADLGNYSILSFRETHRKKQ